MSFPAIHLDPHQPQPLYMQIVVQIQESVQRGEIPVGSLLPPERDLSRQLSVNRSTVVDGARTISPSEIIRSATT